LSSAQLAALDQANQNAEINEYDTYARRERRESQRRRSTHDGERDREQRHREEDRERRRQEHKERRRRQREEEKAAAYADEGERLVNDRRRLRRTDSEDVGRSGRRVVSGQVLERGRDSQYEEKAHYRDDVRLRGGDSDSDFNGEKARKKKKEEDSYWCWRCYFDLGDCDTRGSRFERQEILQQRRQYEQW
jgi:glucan 1,3-beta-glucosidase